MIKQKLMQQQPLPINYFNNKTLNCHNGYDNY